MCPRSRGRFTWLFRHSRFFLDAIYLHPKAAANNDVQGVFDAITELEKLVVKPAAASAGGGQQEAAKVGASYMFEGSALSRVHKVRGHVAATAAARECFTSV